MNELYKLPLGGKPERAIDLRTSNPKEKWYITQVLGFDRAKQLYLIAVKTRLEHPPRGKRIPMLLRVNWDMSSYQVLGWCDADSGIQRAPGARHGIVTPSGNVYFIMRLSEKLQRDKPVDFGLARLTYD
ncbi:MAG TPA: hypothetical protein EYP90_09845 [Chromatiaceae bacterium]|nr:hypothetical protein [Chromatiaceae bacterium]